MVGSGWKGGCCYCCCCCVEGMGLGRGWRGSCDGARLGGLYDIFEAVWRQQQWVNERPDVTTSQIKIGKTTTGSKWRSILQGASWASLQVLGLCVAIDISWHCHVEVNLTPSHVESFPYLDSLEWIFEAYFAHADDSNRYRFTNRLTRCQSGRSCLAGFALHKDDSHLPLIPPPNTIPPVHCGKARSD